MPADPVSGEDFFLILRWSTSCCTLHGREQSFYISSASLLIVIHPIMMAPSSLCNHFPKAQPPNITLRIRISTYEFGGIYSSYKKIPDLILTTILRSSCHCLSGLNSRISRIGVEIKHRSDLPFIVLWSFHLPGFQFLLP
jgi:hypothetical protein